MTKFIGSIACLSLILAAFGCDAGRKTYHVEGTVLFEDGKPAKSLVGGLVSFESVADQSNASGEIRANGSYRLMSTTGVDGVPAGKYRVLVMPPEPRDPDHPPPSELPDRYRSYERSGIEVMVEEKPNSIPIKLRRN